MSISKQAKTGMIAGAVALAIAGATSAKAAAPDADKEKCYGVAKAGQNDCADSMKTHSCMGNAKTDGDKNEWIALPAGVCEKLVGGSLAPAEGDAKASCAAKPETKTDNEG